MTTLRLSSRLILGAILSVQTFAQIGVWKNYTSMKDVRAVARQQNVFWAATSGGMFAWVDSTNVYTRFTNAEGLKSIDLTAIAVDNSGDVWTGSTSGMIHVYSPSTNTWRYITDITTASQPDKQINSFTVVGDTLLISTNFGLSVFRRDRFQFGDTYSRFGPFTGNIRVSVRSAAIYGGRIWAAISVGSSTSRVASADLSQPNLLPPESWTVDQVGSSSTTVRFLGVFNNRLYAGTSSGVFVLNGSSWTVIDSLAGRNIRAFDVGATTLTVVDDASVVYMMDTQGNVSRYGTPAPFTPNAVRVSSGNRPVLGTTGGGLLAYTTSWTSYFPNGPGSNQFSSVFVTDDGIVWGASGEPNGRGFYRFNGKDWKSFDRSNSPILPTNDYYRVSGGCNGDVYASSWGRGVVRMPKGVDTVLAENIFNVNVGMKGVGGLSDTAYVVSGSVICDQQNNTWFTLFLPRDDKVVPVRRPDGSWTFFPVYVGATKATAITHSSVDKSLALDPFGNIWTVAFRGSTAGEPLGAVNLNNRGRMPDSVADYQLTSANGLPGNSVRTIVVDRDGDVWIGTDRGIAIILDPSNPNAAVAAYKPLNGVVINSIAVDPLNQKWVGTNEGAILLSRDGTQTLAQYTVANTDGKIISNEIRSIAVDAKTGTVYFGTMSGLASLTTTAAEPKVSFDELAISPNPYRIPSATPVTIDGLVENSRIKILTVDGKLVRELETPGGRIGFWDGKDERGKDVASGIYLVVAYSETSKGAVGKGKLAVIRK